MELVYLWVEDYKNIKKQGFNFSPRFECDYDGKNLTIEKKEYKSIFSKNINITAIVGENGSGKSALLEVLTSALSESHETNILLSNGIKCDFFLIYQNEESYYSFYKTFTSENLIIKGENQFEIKPKYERLFQSNKNLTAILINNELATRLMFDEYEQLFISRTTSDINDIQKIIATNFINNRNNTFRKDTNDFFLPTMIVIKSLYDFENVNEKIVEILSEELFVMVDYNEQIKLLEEDYHREKEHFFDKLYAYSETSLYSFNIHEIDDKKLEEIFSLKRSNLIDIEISNNDKSFKDLSYGERQLLSNLNFILFYSEQEEYEKERYNEHESGIEMISSKEILILLDELELGLHPNWQKKSIKYIIDFLKYFDKKVHLVATSHSPFILSDLPKENVIFLKDGKQIDALKKKQTFGSNIHTLLSDGFFMSDGLMGEFAKGKIEEIKRFYEIIQKLKKRIKSNETTKKLAKKSFERRQDKFNHIKSIIGEPFLQTVIKNYLDELYLIFSDDEILINKELEELENRKKYLESLKK